MTDIRVVMREQGALGARVDGLKDAVEKLGNQIEKAFDRHTADMKERLGEICADVKETDRKVVVIEQKVAFVKGAMWVLGSLFALAIAVGGLAAAFLG